MNTNRSRSFSVNSIVGENHDREDKDTNIKEH